MKRILIATTIALVATAALAGCGSNRTNDNDTSTSAVFNNADVTFAQAMIPHHEQAVLMAKMAKTQASSPEVKQLAEKIEAAQGPEIDTMTGWLRAWGKDESDSSGHHMDGMDDGDMMDDRDMPGMMSDADLTGLGKITGARFDQMFLTMMISHHEGAIEMAKTEQQNGKFPDAIRLAVRIEEAQTNEITFMKSLLTP